MNQIDHLLGCLREIAVYSDSEDSRNYARDCLRLHVKLYKSAEAQRLLDGIPAPPDPMPINFREFL